MKLSKLLVMGFVGATLTSGWVTGQTFDLKFIEVLNDGNNYEVKIQIESNTSTFGMGTSNLVFTYNTSALSNPTILTAHNFSGGFYSTMTLTTPGAADKISINIDYLAGPGSGTTVPLTYLDVATVRFTTTDPAGNSNLQWWTDSPNRTNVFKDDQATEVTAGTLDNLESSPLPIQLASSAANVIRGNDVEVGWKTVSETNNYGFEVYRKRGEAGEWTKVGFVEGHGTTLAQQSYSYIDRSLSFGQYFYRIKQIDLDGKSETFPEMAVMVGAGAEKFVLAQNYPNPFNPSTVIEFVVPVSGHTTLRVYNVLGQEVARLFEGNAEAGKVNAARFDASSLPSGLYFYTLKNAAKTETKRMLLVK